MTNIPAKQKAQTVSLKKDAVNDIVGISYPKNYYEFDKLNLNFKDKMNRSIDIEGAKQYQVKQNVPLDYVKQLQKDLITLGYLPKNTYDKKKPSDDGLFGLVDKRAIMRFQGHAKRLYRISKGKKISAIDIADIFQGTENGICDHITALEIKKWIDNNWVVQIGKFSIITPSFDKKYMVTLRRGMRSDVADAWEIILKKVHDAGGTLGGEYGETSRPLTVAGTSGSSRLSMHYTGRAIDICQSWTQKYQGYSRRYYLIRDSNLSEPRPFWRIYCRTENQDGSQGILFGSINSTDKLGKPITIKGREQLKHYDFSTKTEIKIPIGYYVDLTSLIELGSDFRRLRSHPGWENSYNNWEWWHFGYQRDLENTFLDECELIGISEADLWAASDWNIHKNDIAKFYVLIDGRPG
jgi:hypothetical protein